MDFNSFEKSIKKSSVSPIYIVAGDETLLIKRSLQLIKEKILTKTTIDMALSEFNGDDTTFGIVCTDLRTVSFFGVEGRRLIVVEAADAFVKKYKKKLQDYFSSPSTSGSLVLVCSKPDSWIKKSEGSKCVIIECAKLRDYQLSSWVESKVKGIGKKITAEAAKGLIAETGNNLDLLVNHINKLTIFVGNRETITGEDVHAIVYDGKKQTIFDLTNAISDKDAANALIILQKLIGLGEEFLGIITLLGWQIRRLWVAKRIIKESGGNTQMVTKRLQSELKVNRYFCEKFLAQVDRYTENGLQTKFGYIADTDVELKTGAFEPQIVVECLIVKLCK